jgi:N-acetylglucosamine kinase-like BadF-type ATPase
MPKLTHGPANPHGASDVVGLDIGGTKTHGVRWSAGEVVAEAKSGSANVQNVTPEEAARNLAELFAALGGEIGRVVAGSGGVDTDNDADALRRLIARQAPDARIDVVHDTRLILAAGAASTGIAVIAGTGSVAWGLDSEGRQARSGGWGYLLGDEGSGYWVGREAVRATLHRFNRAEPLGVLGESVLQATGVQRPEELISLFHGSSGRRYWAGQAHLVFDAAQAGDDIAQRIIEDGARHLCGLVTDVASVLGVHRPVIIGGGLAVHQPELQELLRAALAKEGFDEVRFLTSDPVHGVDYLLRTGGL